MAWIEGTSTVTGVHELADILAEAVIGLSLQTIDAIAAGGTGYVAGDILSLTGTARVVAQAEVLTVGGSGEVLTARVYNAGIYDTAPTSPVSTTGGTGTGCTLTCTFDTNGWERLRATNVAGTAQSATVSTAGTGYVVGETLTLAGGTGHTPATFTVATVGGSGEVLTVSVSNPGSYSTNPSSPNAVTGGSGSGCELTVTFGGTAGAEREIILLGEGSGSDEIYVGWVSKEDGIAQQLELAGMTGFLTAVTWENQPGISPGRSGSNGGVFCPCTDQAINWWVSVTPRRIEFVYRVLSFYGSGHLGFLNSFMTGGEWPYPIFVSGYSNRNFGGLSQTDDGCFMGSPGGDAVTGSQTSSVATQAGGGTLRLPDGTWQGVANTIFTSGTGGGRKMLDRDGFGIWPRCGDSTADWPEMRILNQNPINGPFQPLGYSGSSIAAHIIPTTNSSGDLYLRVPCTVFRQSDSTDIRMYGPLDGIFAINTFGSLVAENRIREGDDFFRVFSAGARTDWKSHYCIAER